MQRRRRKATTNPFSTPNGRPTVTSAGIPFRGIHDGPASPCTSPGPRRAGSPRRFADRRGRPRQCPHSRESEPTYRRCPPALPAGPAADAATRRVRGVWLASQMRMTNSSPPCRATTSAGPTECRKRVAAAFRRLVTCVVTQRVVGGLQVVQVDEQHRTQRSATDRRQRFGDPARTRRCDWAVRSTDRDWLDESGDRDPARSAVMSEKTTRMSETGSTGSQQTTAGEQPSTLPTRQFHAADLFGERTHAKGERRRLQLVRDLRAVGVVARRRGHLLEDRDGVMSGLDTVDRASLRD